MYPSFRTTIRWILLATALFVPQTLHAQTIKVTKSNFSQFTAMNGLYCYAQGPNGQLGLLKKSKLKVGVKWEAVSEASLGQKLSSIQNAMNTLATNGKGNSKKYKKLLAQFNQTQIILATYQANIPNCHLDINPSPPEPPNPAGPSFEGEAESLLPYRDALNPDEVDHLLNKVAFGGSQELRTIGTERGLTALVDALVDGIAPEQSEKALEEEANFWATNFLYHPEDRPGLSVWTSEAAQFSQFVRFFYSRNPFREYAMTLLSGQFATNLNAIGFSYSVNNHEGIPEHVERLRRNALGNFVYLAQEMVYDRAMSKWLNNVDNHNDGPNQNFGREFLELFTLGAIDPVRGTPNYDERSIVAATGYFSGFEEQYVPSPESGVETLQVTYNDDLHDHASRTVFPGVSGAEASAAFDWLQFPVHVLFYHPGASRYIGERLFAQMVYPDVSEEVVADLAQTLLSNSYNLKPFFKKVLRSQAMFSQKAVRPCVASPIEVFSRLYRRLVVTPLPRSGEAGEISNWIFWNLLDKFRGMGQLIFEPPTVFGWKGACGINRAGTKAYGEGYVSSQRLLERSRTCIDFVNQLQSLNYDFARLFATKQISPEEAVDAVAKNIFSLTLTAQQRQVLVHYLTTAHDESGRLEPLAFDLNDVWYVQRRIPRLVCLIDGMLDANMR